MRLGLLVLLIGWLSLLFLYGLGDRDLWALAHYVKSLTDQRGTPAALALQAQLNPGP